jgi:hypothetical protein
MTDIILLDCPFCPSEASIVTDNDLHGDWFNLGCADKECIAHNIFYTCEMENLEKNATLWNTRYITK